MAIVVDPDKMLSEAGPLAKRRLAPSQVVMLLLYPTIFAVGLVVGLVIGIKQGQQSTNLNKNTVNLPKVNSTVIPNANNAVNTNTVNAEINANLNINALWQNADYLRIDAAAQASLNQQEQQDKERLVDQSASPTDIIRQQDLISLKYTLRTYYSVKSSYPSTNGQQIKLERNGQDVLYIAMKEFYGGSFNERIDPASPDYYYGYTSAGQTFELTCYLTSKKKAYTLRDSS